MAKTPSNMLPLGTTAPSFKLPDTVSGNLVAYEDIKSDAGTVVMFICNHCPFVVHVKEQLAALGRDYSEKGISFVAISSNDVENYPDDSPEKMKVFAEENNFSFPYLYDEGQDIAKAYDAACTPDFYIFDGSSKLVYRGQLDDSRPGNDKPLTGADLRAALDALTKGEEINPHQKPSLGCNIKWKSS